MKTALVLLLLFPSDALAWGLQTHVFFAEHALALAALADPQLRAAAARLPRLVLAGACLPDVAIVGRFFLRTPIFARAHRWATLRRITAVPRSDEERALAVGYATHLLSDVIAHNQFVPEHEARIGRAAMVAHLASEWAMDSHVAVRLQPADLLEEAGWRAVEFVARGFRCSESIARRALGALAQGDRLLRRSGVPALCRRAAQLIDRRNVRDFNLYLRKTASRLEALDEALCGRFEDWCGSDPEGSDCDESADRRAREHIARIMQAEHHPRGGGEQRERHQDHREPRIVRARDQSKGYSVQRVP